MIFRTIIKKATKALVNSNSNNFVPTMDEDDDMPLAGNTAPDVDEQPYNEPTDFVEVEEVEEVKVVEPVKVEKVVEEPIALAKPPKVEDLNSDFDF